MKIEESNVNDIIAENIKIARRMKGLTLKEVGLLLGITGQQVQKYEAGKNPIAIDKLLVLARKLGLPINFFFEKFTFDK
jgi:transcriptional regulator with XRE-family HTH domain